MSANQTQLDHFLSDLYSVEQQALAQLVSAPDLAGDEVIAEIFRTHHRETETQAELIKQRLEVRGGNVSAIKDAIMKLGGKGFLLFAALQPETPGKLLAHAYSYEAMEWAGYEMLQRFAKLAGDEETATVATRIRDEERAMMDRLERCFDRAEKEAHQATPENERLSHLRAHLEEAHALENQGIHLLQKADSVGAAELSLVFGRHLDETRDHARLLSERLAALGSSPSTIKDAALGMGGWNWGLFFQAQRDTPAKLAAFSYAFEHLKRAGYELLRRTAQRFADPQTQALAKDLIEAEKAMAERLIEVFDACADATVVAIAKS